MTELASLDLRIDSRPAAEAATALDKMADAAGRGEGRVRQIATAADALIAALNRNTAATNAVTAALAQVEAGSARAERALVGVGTGASAAAAGVGRMDRSVVEARGHLDAMTASARTAERAWAALGAQGAATAQRLEIARRMSMSAAMAPGGAANQNVPDYSGARRANIANLLQQSADVAVTGAMGMNPAMILLQQGPQIAQSFAGPGGLSVKGALTSATEAVGGFLTKIGPAGVAIGGVTATVGLGVAALISYRSAQAEVEKALAGTGRASGVTAQQINDLAEAQSRAAGLSRGQFREVASIYAGQGRVGSDAIGTAVAGNRDLAAFLGVDETEAASAFAGALADVSRGADDLAKRYGLLSDSQRESIQRMDAQGDRLGAQRALMAAVAGTTRNLAEETRGWAAVTATLSNAWDKVGEKVNRAVTGGTLDQRFADARRELEAAQQQRGGFLGTLFPAGADASLSRAQEQVDRIRKLVEARDSAGAQAQAALRSGQVGGVLRSLDPEREELKRLTDQGVLLRKAITDPVKFGLDQMQIDAARRGFADLSTTVRALVEDVDRFGSRAVAALNRAAEFNQRTVGATGYGRSAAEINERFDQQARTANEQERAGLERARQIELSTLRSTQALEQAQRGGAFARAPADIQAMILAATQRFPTVPPEILAAVGEKENAFKLTGPTRVLNKFGQPATSAYGFGQITDDAEADVQKLIPGFNKRNPSTAVEGAAAYLSQRLSWVKGDMIKALDGYGTGPGYGLDVVRRAGQLGDVSSLGVARDADAQRQAVVTANDNLKNVTENYGRNSLALEANGRAQEQYRQLVERGVPAAQAASVAFGGMQEKIAAIGQSARLIQFSRDVAFEREQLGRSAGDQQAYARARSMIGDTTSPAAAIIIEESRETNRLYEARAGASEALNGFASDLRRGATAIDALGNALNRLADRAISSLTDSLVSGVMGSGSGGGGFGGFLGGLFGFGGGSASPTGGVRLFADGGIMTANGAMPLHRYANGGIADRPQLAMFGEGRMPEAYVPLPDGRRIPVAMQGASAANGNGPQSIDQRRTYSIDARGAQAGVAEQIVSALKTYDDEQRRSFGQRMDDWRFNNALSAA